MCVEFVLIVGVNEEHTLVFYHVDDSEFSWNLNNSFIYSPVLYSVQISTSSLSRLTLSNADSTVVSIESHTVSIFALMAR